MLRERKKERKERKKLGKVTINIKNERNKQMSRKLE